MCVNSIYHNLCVILTTPEKLLHMQKYCTIIMADDAITRGGGEWDTGEYKIQDLRSISVIITQCIIERLHSLILLIS